MFEVVPVQCRVGSIHQEGIMTIDRLNSGFIILLTSLLVAGDAGIEASSQETDAESADSSSLIKPDLAGRTALMDQINRALEMESFTTAERLVQSFRERYPSNSGVRGWDNGNEVVYLYHAVYQLGQHHAAIGDLRKTLEVYEDELRSLSLQIPHYSWRFVGLKAPLSLELGLQTPGQIQSMLEQHKRWVRASCRGGGASRSSGAFQESRIPNDQRHSSR